MKIYVAYPTGRGIDTGPSNSPGPLIFRFEPKSILLSVKKETVQKGRKKS